MYGLQMCISVHRIGGKSGECEVLGSLLDRSSGKYLPKMVQAKGVKKKKAHLIWAEPTEGLVCHRHFFTDVTHDYRMFTTYTTVALQRMGFCTCRLPMITLQDFQGRQIVVPFTPHNLWSCNRESFSG